jgi:integrase
MLEIAIFLIVGFGLGYGIREWVSRRRRRAERQRRALWEPPPLPAFPIHPHMLRHSTGFKLANQGVDTRSLQHYLGHKNIQHTVRYSELSPERFRDFWKD